MKLSKNNRCAQAVAEQSLSGLGLVFVVAFMLLCAWGVMRGYQAQTADELFGHNYSMAAQELSERLS